MIIKHKHVFRIRGDEPEAEKVLLELKTAWENLGYNCVLREGSAVGISWLLECEQEIPWGEDTK